MKYITAKEASEKRGISNRRIQLLCKQGRIEGAYRPGWTWAIPENAEKTSGRKNERTQKLQKQGRGIK